MERFRAMSDESAMNDRTVWHGRINQLPRLKCPQDSASASDVSGISMRQQQTIKPIDSPRSEVAAQDAFEIPLATRIEEPVRSRGADVHGGAFASDPAP